jgi:diaminohydroxyphosphoribosylaminopyrimidine deaminase / 5-amino-6-(5-phosphoribosylamino)uracil reductase
MRLALRQARRALGLTTPNPAVGAVVVREGELLGAGYHHRAGQPHAEIEALRACTRDPRGATLYVTLEPCSTHGRTPPCTEAILRAGLSRVVIGALDPNPKHQGQGVALLRAGGVAVDEGILAEECHALNLAFCCWIRQRRPWVTLKLAMSLDGRIATAGGQSQWISGPRSRQRVQALRRSADAIMVGGATVRQDNPSLLVRSPAKWPRQPLRLIATRSGDLGTAPRVLHDGLAPTRLVHCADAAAWQQLLLDLGKENLTHLLVEGGGELAAELLAAHCVDRVMCFIAPIILGGRESRPAIGGPAPASLADAWRLSEVSCQASGDDFLLTGYLSDVHRYRGGDGHSGAS